MLSHVLDLASPRAPKAALPHGSSGTIGMLAKMALAFTFKYSFLMRSHTELLVSCRPISNTPAAAILSEVLGGLDKEGGK
ncbi:hypothetical protein ACLOJK_028470 [Asimina triloba]